VSERNRNPDPHPVLDRLKRPESENETEDVISIVGFVGPRPENGPLRLFADEEGQSYLEIPFEDFVDAEEIPGDDRMRIYVKRQLMVANTFGDPGVQQAQVLQALHNSVLGPPMSLWQFLPQNRLTAAEMLGMLPAYERRYYDEDEVATA
jgi:hypothetical protein